MKARESKFFSKFWSLAHTSPRVYQQPIAPLCIGSLDTPCRISCNSKGTSQILKDCCRSQNNLVWSSNRFSQFLRDDNFFSMANYVVIQRRKIVSIYICLVSVYDEISSEFRRVLWNYRRQKRLPCSAPQGIQRLINVTWMYVTHEMNKIGMDSRVTMNAVFSINDTCHMQNLKHTNLVPSGFQTNSCLIKAEHISITILLLIVGCSVDNLNDQLK